MKEFALIFRMDVTRKEARPSRKQMKLYMEQWMEWIDGIASKGQLSEGGNHFSRKGRVLGPGRSVRNGPHVSEDLSLAGYILITARGLEGATTIAKRCPILAGKNTSVEIRELAGPG